MIKDVLKKGRCSWCGYQLNGLPRHGKCPECGESYNPTSAYRLEPWPSAFSICLRLGWPILGMALAGSLILQQNPLGLVIGLGMLAVTAINSYYRVRSMLQDCLPEMKRTQGVIAILRSVGTIVAAFVVVLTLVPCILFGGCVVLFEGCKLLGI